MNEGTSLVGHEGLGLANALRDFSPPAVMLLDFADEQASFSPEACRLLGIAEPQNNRAALSSAPASLIALAKAVLNGGHSITEQQLQVPSPAAHRRLLRATAIRIPASRVVVLLNDTESDDRIDRRIHQLDRLSNAGTMAASMAHEIKNALVACRTFIDLLLEKNQDADLAEIVRREMGRIDVMVGRMLKFAGPTTPVMGVVHLHNVLEHSLRLVQPQINSKAIHLKRAFAAQMDMTNGDECELQQAFVNLLLNALEAMGPNGQLTVSTNLISDHAGERAEGSLIRIAIQDTGEGIPPENLPYLFEPFFTTKSDGTGLGLAVTKRVVRDHCGTITAEGRLGEGTTFTILLPLVIDGATHPVPAAKNAVAP